MREDYWGGDLGAGEKKAVRQQLFKGNDYWFWMGTEVEQAKVSVHIYDADGQICEQPDSWQKGHFAAAHLDAKDDRQLFHHRGGGEIAGRAHTLGAGLRVSVGVQNLSSGARARRGEQTAQRRGSTFQDGERLLAIEVAFSDWRLNVVSCNCGVPLRASPDRMTGRLLSLTLFRAKQYSRG